MRSRLTRIIIPVIGLLAVTAALALVGTAPLVLFPPSKEAGPRPAPPPASSEVASVTAPAARPGSSPRESPSSELPGERGSAPAGGGTAVGFPGTGVSGEPGGEVGRHPLGHGSEEPGQADEVEHPGQGKGDKEKSKEKEHKGKAKGHSKDKAQGKAKGHAKWQGRTVVALGPRGAKPSHLRSSGAG